ncbi:hypothetical protein Tco_1305878 [Tanacetum coccineum]
MRSVRKGFSRRDTPLFPILMVQAQQEHGEDEAVNKEIDGSLVRAATTASSLEAESARVISSDEPSLGDQEDASKQGRKIDDIDKDAEITLVDETQGRYGDEEVFAGQDMAEKEINVAEKEVSTSLWAIDYSGELVTDFQVLRLVLAIPTETIKIADDLYSYSTLNRDYKCKTPQSQRGCDRRAE